MALATDLQHIWDLITAHHYPRTNHIARHWPLRRTDHTDLAYPRTDHTVRVCPRPTDMESIRNMESQNAAPTNLVIRLPMSNTSKIRLSSDITQVIMC